MVDLVLSDTETDGIWPPQEGMGTCTEMHCIQVEVDGKPPMSCADQPGFLPNLEGVRRVNQADIVVGANWQSFDGRMLRYLYPNEVPKDGQKVLDTVILSRLVYPMIYQQGPNTHLCPPKLRMSHSVKAWGYRLRNNKADYTDWCAERGLQPWEMWRPEMQAYMVQDVSTMRSKFQFLMAQKPDPRSVDIEHGFAEIIRRQEVWGFTFDAKKAHTLNAELQTKKATLEQDLIETFGEWWQPKDVVRVKATRRVKCVGLPDITMARYGTTGKRLPKDYVGPPLCIYEEGAVYTPIERVQFSPSSRAHVHRMLVQKYGWVPTKFTEKKAVKVDDEVLRSLEYPEAPKLADYYEALKVDGYLNGGAQAWLKVMREEEPGDDGCPVCRMHGQIITIGTYTHRCSHFKPNMGQVPSRMRKDEVTGELVGYGHACRELFTARKGFRLVGFDGSGMQLRLLAHYLYKWDKGLYASVFEKGIDPHGFIRDVIGVDLMGEGDVGRGKGKTTNYALVFGGGDNKLGSIIEPTSSGPRKKELGLLVKERMLGTFGTAFDDLKLALKTQVERKGYVTGLDGRKCYILKPHAALAALLQMGEGVVMKQALIIHDQALKAAGLKCGVGPDGIARPSLADYEYCANVHDEVQADVRESALEVYTQSALACVAEAGRRLGVKCPLKSDVKVGANWAETH